jgi:hypothetical protein
MSHLPDLVRQAKDNAISDENAHWQKATGALLEPANALVTAINEGLEHAGLRLGVVKTRLRHSSRPECRDTESRGDMVLPGDSKFSAYLEGKLNEFSRGRLQSLSAWTSDNSIPEKEETESSQPQKVTPNYNTDTMNAPRDHRQLNLVLYTHQMVSRPVTEPTSHTNKTNRSCIRLVWLCLSSAVSRTVYIPKA